MPKTVRRGQDHTDLGLYIRRWSYIVVLCLLVIGIGGAGIEFTVRGYETAGEVVEKSREYQRLVEENRHLEKKLEYLHTPEGEKEAIRRELLYVGEGEQVLEPATEPTPASARGAGRRLRDKLDACHRAITGFVGDVSLQVRCWLGLWKPPAPQDARDVPASEP